MAEENKKPAELVPCLLETIKTFILERKNVKMEDLAKELNVSQKDIEKIIDLAVKDGLLKSRENLKLTKKGEAMVKVHRENYVHNRYVHGTGVLGRLSRIFERKNKNMRYHWRKRHRIDDKAIDSFYSSIHNLKGRVEEIVPLTSLSEGENGVVSYMIGGYGMVRRLTEMGLTPGTTIKVLRRGLLRGPIQIEVRGCCLALGHGVASKVFVKPVRRKRHDRKEEKT